MSCNACMFAVAKGDIEMVNTSNSEEETWQLQKMNLGTNWNCGLKVWSPALYFRSLWSILSTTCFQTATGVKPWAKIVLGNFSGLK